MPKGMREKKLHAKVHEEEKRKKNPCQKTWEKKCMPKSMKKRKERNKDSPYFQIKGHSSKRERVMIKGVQKNILELGTL